MFPFTAYLLDLMSERPSAVRPFKWWPHLRDLPLADPNPTSSEPIQLLIGTNLYTSVLMRECPRLGPVDTPVAQKTIFGWILSGPIKR